MSSVSSKRSDSTSSSIAVDDSDSSVDSDDSDGVSKKKLTSPKSVDESNEESHDESAAELEQSMHDASTIQLEEESDASGEESSSMDSSSSKPKNKIALKRKLTSTRVDSSYVSDSDDSKRPSAYLSEISKCLPDASRMKGAETDVSLAFRAKLFFIPN